MHQTDIIFKIIELMIIALLGYLAGRTGYLPENTGMYLSKLVIKVTAPALILTTMASYDFSGNTVVTGLSVSLFTLIFIGFAYTAGSAVCRLLKLSRASANVFKAHSIFGNTSYLALPLLKSIFGEKGLVYAVFFVIVHDTIVWTLGIYLMNEHKGRSWKENLKYLVNANTIIYVLSLLFAFINLQHFISTNTVAKGIYNILYDVFNPLGNMTLYLMMIFIGMSMAENRIGSLADILKKYPVFVLTFFKLILVPAAAFGVLYLLRDYVNPFARTIIVLELSMPCAMIIPALAAQHGSDYKMASDNVIFTTLFSMVTLPLSLYFLSYIGG